MRFGGQETERQGHGAPVRRRSWRNGRHRALRSVLMTALTLAIAAVSIAAAAITLDTLDGTYTVGEPPGRVEVLFFSFPG